MAGFLQSLKKGLESAAKSAENNEEIDDVFRAVAEDLGEISSGRLIVSVAKTVSLQATLDIPLDVPSHVTQAVYIGTKKRMHRLAYLSRSDTGYPCSLTFDGNTTTVLDKYSLIAAVSEMLEANSTGLLIRSALAAAEKEAARAPEEPPADSSNGDAQ